MPSMGLLKNIKLFNKRNINVVLALHRKAFIKMQTAEKHQCTTGKETPENIKSTIELIMETEIHGWFNILFTQRNG